MKKSAVEKTKEGAPNQREADNKNRIFYRIKFVCFEDEMYSKEDKKRINPHILRRNEVDKR